MRKQFIMVDTYEQALDEAPWAAVIIEVEGGWYAWESVQDYQTAMQQT